MATLQCRFCKNTFDIYGRWDEDWNRIQGCPHCYIAVGIAHYDFVEGPGEDDVDV